MIIAKTLHLLSAIVWVGGMFFAYMIVRPSAAALDSVMRFPLWARIFRSFFSWVWTAIVLLLVSGYWMIFGVRNGFTDLPVYLHLMHGLGWIMILLFLHLWFAPYRRFKQAVVISDYQYAAQHLSKIRLFVGINLVLGLLNSIIGVSGTYWM